MGDDEAKRINNNIRKQVPISSLPKIHSSFLFFRKSIEFVVLIMVVRLNDLVLRVRFMSH
jgi:hypothetical protein